MSGLVQACCQCAALLLTCLRADTDQSTKGTTWSVGQRSWSRGERLCCPGWRGCKPTPPSFRQINQDWKRMASLFIWQPLPGACRQRTWSTATCPSGGCKFESMNIPQLFWVICGSSQAVKCIHGASSVGLGEKHLLLSPFFFFKWKMFAFQMCHLIWALAHPKNAKFHVPHDSVLKQKNYTCPSSGSFPARLWEVWG